METVRITRAMSAHPPHRIGQDEAAEYLSSLGQPPRRIAAIVRGSQIASRAMLLSPDELLELQSIESRNDLYRHAAPELAMEAASRIADTSITSRASVIATSSCTGYQLPGLSAQLARSLGLPSNVVRVPITEAGCAGGVVALTVAAEHLRSRPHAVGLAVACELCSLAFQPGEDDGQLMSNLIFGDGAGAAVLESGPGAGIDVVDTASFLVPGSEDRLGFDLTDAGFTAVLDRCLPDIVPGALVHAAGELLRRHGLTPGDIAAWLLHPGGARILSGIERCLDIGRERTGWTWESMHDYGNASSAAIFDVLARYFERPVPVGDWVVIGAFGPGVSVDLILGRQSC